MANYNLISNPHFFNSEDFIEKKSLQRKIILVTGASKGIGCAVAKSYAEAGATVVLLGRNISELTKIYDEIESAGLPMPAIYPFNLATATEADYEALADSFEKHFGLLDGLLLNAAELGSLTPLEYYSLEHWNTVLQVNLTSQFLLCRALLPLLKRSHHASIIFTSADSKPYWGAYAISKAGISGLMTILAAELQTITTIRVNSINPKAVNTGLRRKAYPAEDFTLLPMPQDIVATYLYLMSKDSQGITGQNFELPS